MALQPGFNLVTDEVDETESEFPALEFFRRLAADETVESRITITGLEDLLYYVDEDDRDGAVRTLRDVLRNTRSFSGAKAVQFFLDGELIDDDTFSLRIERDGRAVYLPVGNLFVEHPNMVTAHHAVARK